MADVGKSTTGHSTQNTQSERDIERLLTNWGNWVMFLPDYLPGEGVVQPMFKDYVAGYRITGESRSPENIDAAEALDPILATLGERNISCLVCNYVLRKSSRQAARFLSQVEATVFPKRHRPHSLNCSYKAYQNWLAAAIVAAELRITYATGIELDREVVSGARKTMRRVS